MASACRIVLIMHQKEATKSTNSGRLLKLALQNCEVRIRGNKRRPLQCQDLLQEKPRPFLLFPCAQSKEISRELLRTLEAPLTLIVPDGNWTQARKVGTREPGLRDLPRLHLPAGPPSQYRLRHSNDPSRLSTFEAVSRALGLIENTALQQNLEKLFTIMVERTLWTRGQLTADQVAGGIPKAALDARRRSSLAGPKTP
jgi:DTW domain-containing protein